MRNDVSPIVAGRETRDWSRVWDGVHPADRAQARFYWEVTFIERELYLATMRVRCLDGRYRWMVVSADPIFDANGFQGYEGHAEISDIAGDIEARPVINIEEGVA